MSLFSSPGFYCRAPDSGVEAINFRELKAAGFRALALNSRDYPWSRWDVVIERATAAGVITLPWGRTLTNAEVPTLCRLAKSLPARAVIVNAEDELIDGRVDPSLVARECSGLDACVSTLAWVGTPAVNLSPLRECEIHLQLFPQENDTSTRARDCLAHAYEDSGGKYFSYMHGMHGIDPRSFPPLRSPYWVYTLDDCQTTWKEWAPATPPALTIPYTGPLYGPSSPKATRKRTGTAKALKLILHEAGFANFGNPDRFYNERLEIAMRRLQNRFGIVPQSGNYGRGGYEIVSRLLGGDPGDTYACSPAAEALIREDVIR